MNRIRVSGWILLLSLALAPACRDMPFNINFDAFSDIVPRDLDGAPLDDAHVGQLISTLDSLLNPADDKPMMRELAASYIRGFRTSFRRGARLAGTGRAGPGVLRGAEVGAPQVGRDDRRAAPSVCGSDPRHGRAEHCRHRTPTECGSHWRTTAAASWCWSSRASGAVPAARNTPISASLMEKYADEPVVLLGVNSDDELATIQEAKVREELHYRTWWDGSTSGPISEAWNVWGWPSTFIMDADGVIRFVNKRQEGMFGGGGQAAGGNAGDGRAVRRVAPRTSAPASPLSAGESPAATAC